MVPVPAPAVIIDALRKVATERDLPMAQIALAWVASNPLVSAPIIGASKERHLDDAIAALEIELSADEKASLEAAYQPHRVVGHA